MKDYERELNCALQSVKIAARATLEVAQRLVSDDTTQKTDRSPVTVADYAAQAIIARTLTEMFPNDAIVGEESASELGRPESSALLIQLRSLLGSYDISDPIGWISRAQGRPAGRFWVLDPVDGTKGFLRKEQYAIALALIEDGEVRVGVLGCPNLPQSAGTSPAKGCIFHAVEGRGAFEQGLDLQERRRIQVSRANHRLVESVESGHSDHDAHSRIARDLGIKMGSLRADSQAKYGMVARGEAALYLRLPNPKTPQYRENTWDHAAGAIIVEAAGGRVTDASGARLDFTAGTKLVKNRGIVASNGELHQAVIDAISKLP